MKFNKEKTKKFASGGKTPKEIMEEARRNQAIERQAQARDIVRDAIRTSGIAAYQSTPVTIQAPRQELVLKEFEPSTFSQAFRAARKAGLKEFTWRGKRYTTELAGSAANTPAVNDVTYDGGVLPELVVTAPAPKTEGQTQQRDWSKVQAPNIDYGTIRADHSPKRIDWGWLRRRLMGLNQGSILYQQGGQLPSYQQGGTIENEESGSMDQLYVDFAIRYLKAKGISEDSMVDDEGGLKDEFLEEVTAAINEVDSPDFWEQYQSNPDAAVQSYIESKMEPEQIEMARKGAKLKKLKKLKKGGIKSRKCKCGCDLIMKKEAGGTIVEVCACGCKK